MRSIDLLYTLSLKEFKVRYKGAFFGYFWALGTPLLLALIFTFAFKHIMRIQTPDYTLFLIIGLFAWQFFSNSTNGSLVSYVQNEQLIKKLCFPRFLLPMSTVLIEGIHFFLGIPVIILFLFIYSKSLFHIAWLYQIPLLWIMQALTCYGIALIISAVNVFFRDMERIISLSLTLAMYLTPVAYPISMVPQKYLLIYDINPMACLITNWRSVFLTGQLDLANLIYLPGEIIILLLFGSWVYKKLSPYFAETL